jgi:DNA-binding MarR family transcriptional regulator
MRHELKGQMAAFGLTTGAFRFLEMLYSEGALAANAVGKRLRTARQNVDRLVRSLEARGWVEKEIAELPPAKIDEKQLAKHKRGLARHGRRVGMIRLTPAGEKFVGEVLPRHMKLVLALMRTLSWREQQTLGSVCRKLREGNAYKMLLELEWEDGED